MAYKGLDERLKTQVFTRDRWRCRWCGTTNRGLDAHHIEYRRGYSYDVAENLISLCRMHHDFVHGSANPAGDWIGKDIAQQVLRLVMERPASTGSAELRKLRRQWAAEGLCNRHGLPPEDCVYCPNLDVRPDDEPPRGRGDRHGRSGTEDQAGGDVRLRLHLAPRRGGRGRQPDLGRPGEPDAG